MPSSACPATPQPGNASQGLKRAMSDAESTQGSKKARRNPSTEPSIRRDPPRDSKRRKKRKKKAPVVGTNEATRNRLDERSRAPLSARNEIIRSSSAPPEADLLAGIIPATKQASSSKTLSKSFQSASVTLDDITEPGSRGRSSTPSGGERNPLLGPFSSLLEEKVARLEAELKSKNDLIASHQSLLNQVQQATTCQICLDLMYKPYALAPCGHLACYSCLVSWFTAPPSDNRPAPPAISRRKTCPHCRAVVLERPVEVWGVKSIAQAAGKSGLLRNQLPAPVEDADGLNPSTDPWKDIFPNQDTRHRVPWFIDDADMDDDIPIADLAPRGEDVGMLDVEDGGIYRCLDCMHEIWDGACSNCGRVYPGHQAEGGDDEGDPAAWLEDQAGAEEIDVADDPGWMGLEDGEADDDGDPEDWLPYEHWGHRLHMFRGPLGFLATIDVDEDEVDDDVGDPRAASEDEDEGYESSFIDDDDEEIANLEGQPRIYEIGDDDDDRDYHSDQHSRIVDLGSDEGEEEARFFDVPTHQLVGRRHASISVDISSGEEAEDDIVFSRNTRQRRYVESDESDPYWSEG